MFKSNFLFIPFFKVYKFLPKNYFFFFPFIWKPKSNAKHQINSLVVLLSIVRFWQIVTFIILPEWQPLNKKRLYQTLKRTNKRQAYLKKSKAELIWIKVPNLIIMRVQKFNSQRKLSMLVESYANGRKKIHKMLIKIVERALLTLLLW